MKTIALIFLSTLAAQAAAPLELGTRWELFVDEHLISSRENVNLKLHEPVKREVVLETNQPWEGMTCAYFTLIQDGKRILMYYRGSSGGSDHSEDQVTCVAESTDGIHFTRPKLGIIEAGGTKDNNVIWRGVEAHNFSPFLDANPSAKPEHRFKALGGVKQPGKNWHQGETPGGLYAFASADGIHWSKIKPEPVITKGAFDSQNLAFYDSTRSRYVCFSRIFTQKVRAVQSSTSTDFLTWSEGVAHRYAKGVPMEHFYTSATVPCPTAPHLFLSFPKRYIPDRKEDPTHESPGASDAVFMSSRDGVNWDRPFLQAWVRPGTDLKNWTERNNMTANGIVVTSDTEWSLYISEHYRHASHRIRRLSVRKQGFASVNAGGHAGHFITPLIQVSGSKLLLNYSTSAAGHVKVQALDDKGSVLTSSEDLFGDEMEEPALDLSKLKGRSIQLRFDMKDADVYALKIAP